MGIPVGLAVTKFLHQARGRIAQVNRHLHRAEAPRVLHGGLVGGIHRIALGRRGQVEHRLGDGELPLRAAEPFLDVPGTEREFQRTRIGIADIFRRHAHHAARHVNRVASAVEHSAQPVECRIGRGAPH